MSDQHSYDFLSEREAKFTQVAMDELRAVEWAGPLLAKIEELGGLTKATKPFLFELRFGHALHSAGVQPRYEIAGEGDSTLDFGFTAGGYEWRVEMMRLEETAALKGATNSETDEEGIQWHATLLTTNAKDKKQSEEGETLKAIERICQKCERGGQPHKFPSSASGINVLLIDFRNFLLGASDAHDCALVALGCDAVGPWFKRSWNGNPIRGAFDPANSLKGAAHVRERVHLLGFVHEKKFEASFGASIQFIANPASFSTAEEAQAVIDA